jgi:hypothetical protein
MPLPQGLADREKIRNFHGVEKFFHSVEVPDFSILVSL